MAAATFCAAANYGHVQLRLIGWRGEVRLAWVLLGAAAVGFLLGLPDPAALVDAGGSGTQSAGTTQWIATNLEPGHYIVACFITDPAAGHVPHAFEGMIDVVQAGDGGTPTA